MAHSHPSPSVQERLTEIGHSTVAWIRADRVRALVSLSLSSLVLAFLLLLLTGHRFGLLSLTVITLALIGVTAGGLALLTWLGARKGRTERADLWDEDEDSTRPADFLIGFQPRDDREQTDRT